MWELNVLDLRSRGLQVQVSPASLGCVLKKEIIIIA